MSEAHREYVRTKRCCLESSLTGADPTSLSRFGKVLLTLLLYQRRLVHHSAYAVAIDLFHTVLEFRTVRTYRHGRAAARNCAR